MGSNKKEYNSKIHTQLNKFIKSLFFRERKDHFDLITTEYQEYSDVLEHLERKLYKYNWITKYLILTGEELKVFDLYPSKQELYKKYLNNEEIRTYILVDFYAENTAEKIVKGFPVQTDYLIFLIKYYLIYKVFFFDEGEKQYGDTKDLCYLLHRNIEEGIFYVLEREEAKDLNHKQHNEEVADIIENYPLSIRFNAHATQRDIREYLKSAWSDIEKLKKKYKKNKRYDIETSKRSFNKDIDERNTLIYGLHIEGFKNNEIVSKLILIDNTRDDGLYDLESGEVAKIISETKKLYR